MLTLAQVLRRGVAVEKDAEGRVVDARDEGTVVEWKEGRSLLVQRVQRGGGGQGGKKVRRGRKRGRGRAGACWCSTCRGRRRRQRQEREGAGGVERGRAGVCCCSRSFTAAAARKRATARREEGAGQPASC